MDMQNASECFRVAEMMTICHKTQINQLINQLIFFLIYKIRSPEKTIEKKIKISSMYFAIS